MVVHRDVPPTPSAPYGPAAGGNPYGGQNPYGNLNAYNQAPPSYNQYSQFAAPSAGMTTGVIPLDQPHYGCPFPEAFLRFWKKYVVFTGRASRSEYWWWTLAALGINFALGIIADVSDDKLAFLTGIWTLAIFIPGLAVSVRRLHDINKSGWWLAALYGVMVIGVILMIAGGGAALFGDFLGFSHGDYNNVYGAAADFIDLLMFMGRSFLFLFTVSVHLSNGTYMATSSSHYEQRLLLYEHFLVTSPFLLLRNRLILRPAHVFSGISLSIRARPARAPPPACYHAC